MRDILERLQEWLEFAAEARTYGESMCGDDYFNDVSKRDLLERKRAELTDEQAELLLQADRTFFLGTRRCQTVRLSGQYWWHFRVPLEPGEELGPDIRDLEANYRPTPDSLVPPPPWEA